MLMEVWDSGIKTPTRLVQHRWMTRPPCVFRWIGQTEYTTRLWTGNLLSHERMGTSATVVTQVYSFYVLLLLSCRRKVSVFRYNGSAGLEKELDIDAHVLKIGPGMKYASIFEKVLW